MTTTVIVAAGVGAVSGAIGAYFMLWYQVWRIGKALKQALAERGIDQCSTVDPSAATVPENSGAG